MSDCATGEANERATGDGTRSVPATGFEFFDPRGELLVREGNLPHWHQPGVTYFVTFRTEDSVPRNLLLSWHARRDDWLRRHGIDPSLRSWKARLAQCRELEREFHTTFTRDFMEYLDRGYGACALRQTPLAEIVADSLRSFHGQRYHLGDFVVMPNHVHLLVCLLGSTNIERQCRSWKKFTAGEINRALRRTGRFWQEESFDHLVRGPEQCNGLQQYIADNPQKAKLRAGEYLYCSRPT
jgi:putative transposase